MMSGWNKKTGNRKTFWKCDEKVLIVFLSFFVSQVHNNLGTLNDVCKPTRTNGLFSGTDRNQL